MDIHTNDLSSNRAILQGPNCTPIQKIQYAFEQYNKINAVVKGSDGRDGET